MEEQEQQPGGWGGWEEMPPAAPPQKAPGVPEDPEEGELDEDAEAEFAPEGALSTIQHSCLVCAILQSTLHRGAEANASICLMATLCC